MSCVVGTRIGLCLAVAVAVIAGAPSTTQASPRLQVFLRVEGTVPDWREMSVTVTRLQVIGFDAVMRRHYFESIFEGSQSLSVPRAAAGSPRLLAAGDARVGRVSMILVTLGTARLTTEPPSPGGPAVTPWPSIVVPFPPVQLTFHGEETRSVVTSIKLGKTAFVTGKGALLILPLLAGDLLPTPTAENYLNGGEILSKGPRADFPELGIQVDRAKILDPATGDVRDLTLQTSSGAPVSFPELRNQNDALWRAHHGSLNPALVRQLAPLPSTELVLADVWLDAPGAPATLLTDASTPEAWDVAHASFVAQRRAAAAPIAANVAAALTAAGATVLDVELDPGVLHIQASRSVLESTAAQLGNVREVAQPQLPAERVVLATKGAVDLVQEPLHLAHLLGAGQGLRIAVAEDLACINQDHEAFEGVTFEAPLDQCSDTSAYAGHSTAVAGALAAFVPDHAPDQIPPTGLVGLFQGRVFSANLCGSISDRLLERSPHLINSSCVNERVDGEIDRFAQVSFDYAVFTHRVFVAGGAGNVPTGEDGSVLQVLCPSYNALCVGGYVHLDTLGPGNFGDDLPANRWLNDRLTGRERPDVVGPNTANLPKYNDNGAYVPFGGTSFATPFVVGTAALLMANHGADLLNNPTLLRAVLMASARHSFAGFPAVPLFGDNVDDRTGAGAPRGDRARDILQNDHFFTGFVNRNANFDAAGFLTTPISFLVNAGDRVRVVLSYDQCQVGTNSTTDNLFADLDLVVMEGAQARTNNSHVDNHEVVEFTASAASQIRVRTRRQFWNPCADQSLSTHMAIAWDVLHPGEL